MARRAVHEFARRFDFDEVGLGEIDIVVQEIGTNAVRYASEGGWLHYAEAPGEAGGLELFYWDGGPGIYNIDRAARDGVSTSGSLGAGLGAIRRLTDEFDVYSTVRVTGKLRVAAPRYTSHGTALLARKWAGEPGASFEAKRIGAWSQPHPGEEVCGDSYLVRRRGALTLLAVVDGLGHGAGAKEAADAALDSLDEWEGEPLDELLTAAHHALRATRGAVAAVAVVDDARGQISYAGVGNISARAFNAPEPVTLIPVNGLLGGRLGKPRVWTHRWAAGATLVMTTDGLSESWDISSYPGLLERSPQLLAGVLMRDYNRRTDDATVLVAK
jgi:anti-sigma regulatory factor (Ser/Thr protein kinase)